MVSIIAGGEKFSLPKALLCYNSPFFDKAFNGNFLEGKEQEMVLSDCSAETFRFVIQWIFTSQVVLSMPRETEQPMLKGQAAKFYPERISKLLAFLKVADRIQLLGPFNQVTETIKAMLTSTRASLQAGHIRAAFEIPSAHEARKLFTQACVREYAESFFDGSYLRNKKFRFKEELRQSDAFAAALLTELANSFRSRTKNPPGGMFEMTDPFSGYSYSVSP
jgi:BTB/POZ domain